MKIELKQFSTDLLKNKRLLFVYGNLPELADALHSEFMSSSNSVVKFNGLASDFIKINVHDQGELYDTGTNLYRIRNVTDSNAEEVISKISKDLTSVFILTPGEYKNAKNTANTFSANPNWMAIPAFKNKITYNAICRYFFKNISNEDFAKITEILERSDEPLSSSILKLSLLCECDSNLLSDYALQSNNWVFDMAQIALLRLLSSSYIKSGLSKFVENLYNKNDIVKIRDILSYCLKAEIRIKNGEKISNEMILNDLLLEKNFIDTRNIKC